MSVETALATFLAELSDKVCEKPRQLVTSTKQSPKSAENANSDKKGVSESKGSPLPIETQRAINENIEERAAIMEFNGSLPRKQTEQAALSSMCVYSYRLKEAPKKEPVLIAPNTTLVEAKQILIHKYGNRLMTVTQQNINKEILKK